MPAAPAKVVLAVPVAPRSATRIMAPPDADDDASCWYAPDRAIASASMRSTAMRPFPFVNVVWRQGLAFGDGSHKNTPMVQSN